MKPKAQAGLEYLMTYGWALVLIVTVAGVLFFVMAPPTESFVCRSSDPTKIIMKSYTFPYAPNCSTSDTGGHICSDPNSCMAWGATMWTDPTSEMLLQNATGGDISITNVDVEDINDLPCAYRKIFTPGQINGVSCLNGFDYYRKSCPVNINPSNPIAITKGGNIILEPGLFVIRKSGTCSLDDLETPASHSFSLDYSDQFGYAKEVTITCQGYPPVT